MSKTTAKTKKEYKTEPTQKQRKAFNLLMSDKVRTKGEAMLKAGYKPTVALRPKRVTETTGWKRLMQQYMPDDKLALKHNEGLEATKKVKLGKKPEVLPDYEARYKYLRMAYQLKNMFPKEAEQNNNIMIQVKTF